MTQKILLGIWKHAPFQRSIISSVDSLNIFLKEKEFDMQYDVMRIEPKELSENMTKPDVFILDGGEDVNPARYGEKNRSSYFSEKRDEIEFGFAQFMANHNVRMAGVCRGHQLLNVFLGGTLYQDINRDGCVPDGLKHSSGHKVKVGGGSIRSTHHKNLAIVDFVGTHPFSVSSLHHQAVNQHGRNVRNSLVWEGYKVYKGHKLRGHVVEGIETTDSMVRAVQSHPEFKGFAKDGLLFAYLMFVDYFSSPLLEVKDDEVVSKFSKLISKRELEKKSKVGQFVNMSPRQTPEDVARDLRNRQHEDGRVRRDEGAVRYTAQPFINTSRTSPADEETRG
jgi:putative glutamine amidotransferase